MWHERDVSNIRLVASAVNRDQTSTIAQMPIRAERRRCQRPQAVRDARSKRSGALTPPSTASQFDARWLKDLRATRRRDVTRDRL